MFAEVNVLKKLDHPNIVKLYELYQDPKNYYLVTEYEKQFVYAVGFCPVESYSKRSRVSAISPRRWLPNT
jgi:serine/threonine protein kinase